MTLYENPTNFDYRLMPSNNQPPVFKNDGRNTEIVFLFDNKMKIHARNKAKVVYSLVFTEANQANIFAGLLISVAPAQYLVRTSRHSAMFPDLGIASNLYAL